LSLFVNKTVLSFLLTKLFSQVLIHCCCMFLLILGIHFAIAVLCSKFHWDGLLISIYFLFKVTNVTQVDTQTLSVTLTTDSIAPFVWLETPTIRGWFSNNGFIMVEPEKVLLFHAWDKHISIAEFYRCLTIKSLMDLYE